MTKSQRPQVFIEKIMPVKLLNQQVYYEHGGNPYEPPPVTPLRCGGGF